MAIAHQEIIFMTIGNTCLCAEIIRSIKNEGMCWPLKAIIMAGGRGMRLMPISAHSPKPMAKLMGLPVLEHIVELLRANGFTELCMTLGHMPEQITDYFGDGTRFGVSIDYRFEKTPLGTAGGVRSCADFFGDEDFLVISGDAACDFELKELVKRHVSGRAEVTMALYRHAEPLQYGTVLVSKNFRVRQFIEKPSWERVVTDLVNTGIYIISPHVMGLIKKGAAADFAKDIFPILMESEYKIFGVEMDGYWCDIGDAKSYRRCCMDALDGRLKLRKTAPGVFLEDSLSFVCGGAQIDKSAILKHSVIHPGGKVAANSRIIDSVVDGGEIGMNCLINGSVVCRGAVIGDYQITDKGDVIAASGKHGSRTPQWSNTAVRQRKRGLCRELSCTGRAALMRELSGVLWETGADFSDGITLQDGNCRVHISPMEDESALSMEAFGGREKERIIALKKYYEMASELETSMNCAANCEYTMQD